jgi:uncharacterized protein
MAHAFVQLYAVTADRGWLNRAADAMGFIDAKFNSDVGYIPFAQPLASKLPPRPNVDENIAVARTANLLNHYTNNQKLREMAEHAMKFLAAPAVCENHGYEVAGILLAADELATPPLHITIVGAKTDAAARRLFQTALAQPSTYKRVEWWDRKEGPLPNPDVDYPDVGKAAAFLCTDRSCSAPIFDPAKISTFGKHKKK